LSFSSLPPTPLSSFSGRSTASPYTYTLSLHDALPISARDDPAAGDPPPRAVGELPPLQPNPPQRRRLAGGVPPEPTPPPRAGGRSLLAHDRRWPRDRVPPLRGHVPRRWLDDAMARGGHVVQCARGHGRVRPARARRIAPRRACGPGQGARDARAHPARFR